MPHPLRLELRFRSWKQGLPFLAGGAPAYWLKTALRKFDPDILLTDFGDTWLLEDLLEAREGQSLGAASAQPRSGRSHAH